MMFIEEYIKDSIKTKQNILENEEVLRLIKSAADVIVSAYRVGNKILTAGNGGSAGDAQHIAGELVSKFNFDRPALSAISLTTDTFILTAASNDYGYEHSFSRQVQAHGQKGDVFIAISTSGNSKNILFALEEATKKGLVTIGLTGANKSEMDGLCDIIIKVPSDQTPKIQESHTMIGHIICAIVENELFKN